MSSSDDDDGRARMRFTVDNDYEDGQFIGGEFFARGVKKGRQQTREERIYGVFADGDGSSDDDDTGGGRRGRKGGRGGRSGRGGRGREAVDSRPMDFVSSSAASKAAPVSDGEEEEEEKAAGAAGSDMELDSDGEGGGGSAAAAADADEIDIDDGVNVKEQFHSLLRAAGVGAAADGDVAAATPVAAAAAGGGEGAPRDSAASVPARTGAGPNKNNADFRAFLLKGLGASAAAAPKAEDAAGDNVAATPASSLNGQAKAAPAAAASKAPVRPAKLDADFGQWEKHTKGFGSSLLKRMGFKGRLGKEQTGVTRQLEVKVRPQGIGLGFGDFKEAASMRVNREIEAHRLGKTVEELEKEMGIVRPPKKAGPAAAAASRAEAAADAGLWRKGAAGKRKKRQYVSAEEALAKATANDASSSGGAGAGSSAAAAPRQVVVDMRGPQVKLLSSLEDIAFGEEAEEAAAAAAEAAAPKLGQELLHNVSLIVELAEHELREAEQRRREATARTAVLTRETEELRRRAGDGPEKLEQVSEIISRVRSKIAADPGAVPPEAVLRVFVTLRREYPEVYAGFRLANLAPNLGAPVLRRALAGWRPLVDPNRGPAMLAPWRPVLAFGDEATGAAADGEESDAATPWRALSGKAPRQRRDDSVFEFLATDILLPHVRSALINEWDASDVAPALAIISSLADGILTRAQLDVLLAETVAPRLAQAVAQWQPRGGLAAAVAAGWRPPDAWLLPWLPTLAAAIVPLFQEVRRKLAAALRDWNPVDSAMALMVLRPWASVFDAKSMEALLVKAIVPALAAALRAAPAAEPPEASPLAWTLCWRGLLPEEQLAALLEGEFFPGWLATLHAWLATGTADFGDVAAWYQRWKAFLPEDLLEDSGIKAQVAAALQLMDKAVREEPLPPDAWPPTSYIHVAERRRIAALAVRHEQARRALEERKLADETAAAAAAARRAAALSHVSFREVVAAAAAEAGVEFLPRPGRQFEGKPLYTFGGTSVYLENDVVFAETTRGSGVWKPLSLDNLVDYARKRATTAAAGGGGG